MPLLGAVKKLGIRTILGPQMEDEVNWYLEPGHQEKLLGQLLLQLEKISLVVQHYAISVSCFFSISSAFIAYAFCKCHLNNYLCFMSTDIGGHPRYASDIYNSPLLS